MCLICKLIFGRAEWSLGVMIIILSFPDLQMGILAFSVTLHFIFDYKNELSLQHFAEKINKKKGVKTTLFCNCNCNCRCHGQLVHSSPKIFLNAFYAFSCFLYCNDDLNSLLKCLQTIYSHVILFDFLHAKLFSRLKNSYLNAKFGMEVANTHKNYMTSKNQIF